MKIPNIMTFHVGSCVIKQHACSRLCCFVFLSVFYNSFQKEASGVQVEVLQHFHLFSMRVLIYLL